MVSSATNRSTVPVLPPRRPPNTRTRSPRPNVALISNSSPSGLRARNGFASVVITPFCNRGSSPDSVASHRCPPVAVVPLSVPLSPRVHHQIYVSQTVLPSPPPHNNRTSVLQSYGFDNRIGNPPTGYVPVVAVRMEPSALLRAKQNARATGKTVSLWLEEAIQEKIGRERGKDDVPTTDRTSSSGTVRIVGRVGRSAVRTRPADAFRTHDSNGATVTFIVQPIRVYNWLPWKNKETFRHSESLPQFPLG